MPTPGLKAAAIYAALHVLLLLALAAMVSRQRKLARVGIGDGGHPLLGRYIRIHGNAVEQAVPTMALLVMLALLAAPLWTIHLFGVVTLIARVLHAAGLQASSGTSFGRLAGTILSWSAFGAGAIALLLLAVS